MYAINKEESLIKNGLRALGYFLESFFSLSDNQLQDIDTKNLINRSYNAYLNTVINKQ